MSMTALDHGLVDPMSSSGVRDAIVSRHEGLRVLVAETVELARTSSEPDALRAHARSLYHAFEEHLSFEERAFPEALHDVIGWGPVLQEQIEREHLKEREALASALSALEPDTLSFGELASSVRAFAAALLDDIEREEAALLNAELDYTANDAEGG
jgi:hypothetical protein